MTNGANIIQIARRFRRGCDMFLQIVVLFIVFLLVLFVLSVSIGLGVYAGLKTLLKELSGEKDKTGVKKC